MKGNVKKSFVAIITIWLVACGTATAPAPTPTTQSIDPELTRIAATLAAIPTASLISSPTSAPKDTPTAALPTPTLPAKANDNGTYTVQTGDTLSTIALQFNTSMASLQIENDLDTTQVLVGQKLKLPKEKFAPDEGVYWIAYTIKAGDTLGVIAQRNGVTLQEVMRVNNIKNPALIKFGQRLVLPINTPGANPPAAVAQAETRALPKPTEPQAARASVTPLSPTPSPTFAPIVLPTLSPAPVIIGEQNTNIETMRSKLLELYNQSRALGGLPSLRMSAALQTSAQLHANDNAARGFGSHTGSDGSTSKDRITRAGYAGKFWGENWAWSRTPEEAFDLWFTQEPPDGPHRKNIMSPNYNEVGFGIAGSKGGYFFIANFGGQ